MISHTGNEILHRTAASDPSAPGASELVRRSDARWGTDQFHYDPMGRVREHTQLMDAAGVFFLKLSILLVKY